MSDLPLVSLVTPAYNQGEYLAETIESVLAQDYPRLEYIVIDDGSSDDSLSVARRYESRGVRVLTQANAGQAATLNRGWSQARGDWLGYLSSDDRLEPHAIRTLVESLQPHPDAAAIYGDFCLIDSAGRRIRDVEVESFDIDRLTIDLICQPGPGALFARRVFEATRGWNPNLRQVPDFDFWLRASTHGDLVKARPGTLAEYRIHEGSASFKPMSTTRADEIVTVVDAYWTGRPQTARSSRARARALCFASKNHAQSGRPLGAVIRLVEAFRLAPALVAQPSVWRQVIVGYVRRLAYRARALAMDLVARLRATSVK